MVGCVWREMVHTSEHMIMWNRGRGYKTVVSIKCNTEVGGECVITLGIPSFANEGQNLPGHLAPPTLSHPHPHPSTPLTFHRRTTPRTARTCVHHQQCPCVLASLTQTITQCLVGACAALTLCVTQEQSESVYECRSVARKARRQHVCACNVPPRGGQIQRRTPSSVERQKNSTGRGE